MVHVLLHWVSRTASDNYPLQDIANNFVWLKPLATKFPAVVPGGIILTDIWLYLDQLLDNKRLVKPHMSKVLQAGLEAERCKKLMGALRYLYRNSILLGGVVAIVAMSFHNV